MPQVSVSRTALITVFSLLLVMVTMPTLYLVNKSCQLPLVSLGSNSIFLSIHGIHKLQMIENDRKNCFLQVFKLTPLMERLVIIWALNIVSKIILKYTKNCIFAHNLAFYRYLIRSSQWLYFVYLCCSIMPWTTSAFFTGIEVISTFKSNQSREPISETTSENSSLKLFPFRTTLGIQISIRTL